jgi:hypothetical protein
MGARIVPALSSNELGMSIGPKGADEKLLCAC